MPSSGWTRSRAVYRTPRAPPGSGSAVGHRKGWLFFWVISVLCGHVPPSFQSAEHPSHRAPSPSSDLEAALGEYYSFGATEEEEDEVYGILNLFFFIILEDQVILMQLK